MDEIMGTRIYQVAVSNIGVIHTSMDVVEAQKIFHDYIHLSDGKNETVTLSDDDGVIRHYESIEVE